MEKPKTILFPIIVLATCATQFATDIYAPSLLEIADNLQTSISHVQISLAIYMVGVALSQLIYGPLSEVWGRKIPLTLGLLIMLIGNSICLMAPSISQLIIGRLIQGCGAGACAALWRTIFRDLFTGVDLARLGSYLVIFVTFIVPAAPIVGGYLEETFNWQACFVFMGGYISLALFLVQWKFQETNLNQQQQWDWRYMIQSYKQLLSNRLFMGTALSTFFSYGALFSWIIIGPVIFINDLKFTPSQFGYINFFASGITYALSGIFNGRYVSRWGMSTMMRFGWALMICSGIALWTAQSCFEAMATAMIIFYFGSTLIWPNALATAFTPFGHIAGYAGALYGFMQIGGAAVIGNLITLVHNTTQIYFAGILIMTSLIAWLCYELGQVKNS